MSGWCSDARQAWAAPEQNPVAFAPTIPGSAFAAFQMMFAVITPALIAGAFAERMRFGAYVMFIALWSLLVYSPIAHWVWGGGFLGANGVGALDFAGGTVVHISAGAAALAAVLFIGRRTGYRRRAIHPAQRAARPAGAGILWFGWFGFNAGSALGANALAASAFVTTHLGAAGALIGGSPRSASATGRPRRSAPRPGRSPGSSPSRPQRDSSSRCPRSSSGWPPAWSASSRSG
jgi:Amt family ammonium transporter